MNDNLRAALDPRSIAIVGASDNTDKVGGRPLDYLQRFGYGGKLFPVNPGRAEVQGLKAYGSIESLPETPEMAIVAIPGDTAVDAVRQCADRGTKVAIIMSSGFGEGNSAQGRDKEADMVRHARERGMRIVGPNSQGLANFGTGAVASFSTMFKENAPADGHVAVLSQSGALSVVPYGFLRRRGIGVRHAHATGNDADVTIAELAAAVAEDTRVKLMLLYLEGIPDPHHLEHMARIARDRKMPILALKSGRTPDGRAAAQSHTGALANEDRVVDAFFEHHGIWRAQTMNELVDATELYLKGWTIRGRKLVAVSNSGAVCVLAADAAAGADMPMAKLSASTRTALGRILPSFANISNPIDVTGALLTDSSLFGKTLGTVGADPAADAFFVGFPVAGAGYDVQAFAAAAGHLEAATGKPVVAAAPQPNVAAHFIEQGIPTFPTEAQAIAALGRCLKHYELMDRAAARQAAANGQYRPYPAPNSRDPATPATTRMLNEADSLGLLAGNGLAMVEHRLCTSLGAALDALESFGGAVVMKGCSGDVAHKTELGIVKLGIRTKEEAAGAWQLIEAALAARQMRLDGIIVARMERGRHELMIGAHRDPVFGPVVVVGDGGKYVEALPDVQLLLPPFRRQDALEKLRQLRIAPIFAGVRGEAPMDIGAVADAAVAVGQLMATHADIHSVDVNPILLKSQGEGYCALDAVVLKTGE
ncbi:acetate--CoA ligase family protein [Bordetella sp. BOR01]|uniref:acetate--CoA ligase family protein n=1 Tax=Bordetella sp. BOR01 TaxID=2854779 RepID=UPI001C44A97D|nr:acetate--CoA ligase family protein [Bordetella sp. BOR01]MBV7484570.1 acetate--CoA ligase family protein [Bordetella sp. BOR01]